MARILTVQIRHKDEWIIDELEKIVEVKRVMGISTSMGFEVARLLRKAIVGDHEEFIKRSEELGLMQKRKEGKE